MLVAVLVKFARVTCSLSTLSYHSPAIPKSSKFAHNEFQECFNG
ncbi:hypothetical protein PI124_g23763 [Phytophthora idaei]|nr:hypothetical protein PI125_g25649 [Phytophthora idaei]KAG3123846.1 hypothetical protein PI126_g23520 [Phytophthora idaei]KAG3231142.1 hypothetical protein PI124_g23763 [Phytophthora idaei]